MKFGPSWVPEMEWVRSGPLQQKFVHSVRTPLSSLSTDRLRGGGSKKKFDPFLVFLARVRGASKKVFGSYGSYLVPLAWSWVRVLAGISSVTPGARLRPSPAPSPGWAGDRTYPLCTRGAQPCLSHGDTCDTTNRTPAYPYHELWYHDHRILGV
jgi:hypothetical protein